jgi:hypothetical protein
MFDCGTDTFSAVLCTMFTHANNIELRQPVADGGFYLDGMSR